MLLFRVSEADVARDLIIKIARDFDQGGIFEYRGIDDDDTMLRRWTVDTQGRHASELAHMYRVQDTVMKK